MFEAIILWGSLVGLLAQAIAAFRLLVKLFTRSPFSRSRKAQFLWSAILGGLPVVWQLYATWRFSAAYQIPRARWFYFVHNEAAGLVLTPFLIAAAYAISWGMVRRDYQLHSRTHLLMVVIAALSCLWYNASIACLGYTSYYWRGDPFLGGARALFPAISGVNYTLLAIWTMRCGGPFEQHRGQAHVGVWAFLLSLAAKCRLAGHYLIQNAAKPPLPSDYGDCFVVGAAAHGHRRLVGSWRHPQLGKPVNRQWYRFKAFETVLERRLPLVHRVFRRIYNVLGPCLARRVRNAWIADIVYLSLKPLEWMVAPIGWRTIGSGSRPPDVE